MQPTEKSVHLLIADISGFTQYIWKHRESTVHAQVIINDLLQAMLTRVEPPLEVAKLEGDAIFLYVPLEADLSPGLIPETVTAFFEAFEAKQRELYAGNLCHCSACSGIGGLRLKVLLHSGSALFFSLGRFQELSGPDVITIHRLTKNSVQADQYVLATEAAFERVSFPPEMAFAPAEERYPDIGRVPVRLHFPGPLFEPANAARKSWGHGFGREWVKYWKAFPYRFGLKRITLPRE